MPIFKKIISIFFRIAISIILLIFLFKQVDKRVLFEIIKGADKWLLFLSFLIFSGIYILCLLRWEMLLKSARIYLPLKRVIISYCGGIFFSLFLPSTIGGDFMRSVDLGMHTQKPRQVVATVLLDRLSGYIGVVLLVLPATVLGFRFIKDTPSVFISCAVLVLILIAILLVLFNSFIYTKVNNLFKRAGRLTEAIRNLHEELHNFKQHKKMIIYNIIFSIIIQSITPVSFYFLVLSLGMKLPFIYFIIFVPIIGAITLLPISLGGLGLRDTATIFFFTKIGLTKDLAFALSLLNFSFVLIYGIIGGLVYLLTVRHRKTILAA